MFGADPFSARSLEDLARFVDELQQKIENMQRNFEIDSIRFTVHNTEPDKPRDGELYFADGSNWDPGNGRGLYIYDSRVGWVHSSLTTPTGTPIPMARLRLVAYAPTYTNG